MDQLLEVVEKLASPRVLVVGDVVLDCYVEGSANRVSPEAPVLVFEAQERRYLLGGACNVAANLAALGGRAAVLGLVGEDVAGEQLIDLLRTEGIDTSMLIRDPSRPTTRKVRFVSKTAQVLRVDEERRHEISGAIERAVMECLQQRPFPFDAVLLSDYGKGLLSRKVIAAAIEAAHAAGGLAVVDPKARDYSVYRGADLLTPNREEAEAATGVAIDGMDSLHEAAAALRRLCGLTTPTITLGKDGIYFEDEAGAGRIIPTLARSVFDVTGAGDTVVAVLTLARTSGVSLPQSLELANLAAGIVVGRFGTWAVSREELLTMLGRRGPGKVLTRAEAVSTAARMRAEGRRLAFTNGCFDLLHPGHTDYLTAARSYGDALMVAVNTDASVRAQAKGDGRPVTPLEDRMTVLAALQAVDYVVPFGEETPLDLIKAVSPQVLIKGEDWRDKGVVGREWVEAHGGRVVLVSLRPGCSTTAIIDRIRGA